MTDPRGTPERIELGDADDPRDVIHRAVAVLAQGGCLGISTSSQLLLIASGLHCNAVLRLTRFPLGPDLHARPILLLRSVEEIDDWLPHLGQIGRRFARRAWPGSVVLCRGADERNGLLTRLSGPVQGTFDIEPGLALNVPDAPFLREVMRLVPGPLVARRYSHEAVAGDRSEPSDLVIQDRSESESHPTWVRLLEDGWEVPCEGDIDHTTLTRMAATSILFVCTGNTCRSPMAEALCKVVLAERLGCAVEDLPERGYVVESAGLAAIPGMPAAANALEVIRARGGSLQFHISRRLSLEQVLRADHVLAMTSDHLDSLLEHAPEAAQRARLLHPEGADVADPIGADRATYQRTAEAIENYLTRFIANILPNPQAEDSMTS